MSDNKQLTEDEEARISGLVAIIDPEDSENPTGYSVEDSTLEFRVIIDKKAPEGYRVEGSLLTDCWIQGTDLAAIKTWRFELQGVSITQITCLARDNRILYEFTAQKFLVAS